MSLIFIISLFFPNGSILVKMNIFHWLGEGGGLYVRRLGAKLREFAIFNFWEWFFSFTQNKLSLGLKCPWENLRLIDKGILVPGRGRSKLSKFRDQPYNRRFFNVICIIKWLFLMGCKWPVEIGEKSLTSQLSLAGTLSSLPLSPFHSIRSSTRELTEQREWQRRQCEGDGQLTNKRFSLSSLVVISNPYKIIILGMSPYI